MNLKPCPAYVFIYIYFEKKVHLIRALVDERSKTKGLVVELWGRALVVEEDALVAKLG